MFALAHLALQRLLGRGVAAEGVLAALNRFDETCLDLTRGQHADMGFELRETVPVEEYLEMITGKTSVLLGLCADLGANRPRGGTNNQSLCAVWTQPGARLPGSG